MVKYIVGSNFNYQNRYGRATGEKVFAGKVWSRVPSDILAKYATGMPSVYKLLGDRYDMSPPTKFQQTQDRANWYMDLYLYITSAPKLDDEIPVGGYVQYLSSNSSNPDKTCGKAFSWGQITPTRRLLFHSNALTSCSGDPYYGFADVYIYIKQYAELVPADLVPVGGYFQHVVGPRVMNVISTWGEETSTSQQVLNNLNLIHKYDGYDNLQGFFYLDYVHDKFNNADKYNCCMRRWPKGGRINSEICAIQGYEEGTSTCDSHVGKVCSGAIVVPKEKYDCACINSAIPQAHCFDANCSNYGYKLRNMHTSCEGSYVDCKQIFDMADNKDVKLLDANISQYCGAYKTDATMPSEPRTIDDVEEQEAKSIVGIMPDKQIMPAKIHNKLQMYSVSDMEFIFIIFFFILALLFAYSQQSEEYYIPVE